MLGKRVQGLAKSLAKAADGTDLAKNPERRPSPSDLSLKNSAVTRAASWRIGRGASTGLLQEFASAAIEESGHGNVSRSAWAHNT